MLKQKNLVERVKSIRRKAFIRLSDRDELQQHLRTISERAEMYIRERKITQQLRVLWSPGFNINRYFWIHDGLLSTALRLRGVEVVPLMCDQLQKTECNVFGGVWVAPASWHRACDSCAASDFSMWKDTFNLSPVKLSAYQRAEDKAGVMAVVEHLDDQAWQLYEYDNLVFGKWARDSVMNMYMLGRLDSTKGVASSGRNFIYNGLLLYRAYQRILKQFHPDRVITHDGTYLMWVLLDSLAERQGIPYFTYYSGDRKDTWHYVRNGISLQWDPSPAWDTWCQTELSEAQNNHLDTYLTDRQTGKAFVLNPVPQVEGENFDLKKLLSQLDPDKPIVLLAGNVIWDAASLNKERFFSSQLEWVSKTISFFASHPEIQLVVKPHPSETNPKIPHTQHALLAELDRLQINIPANVILLPPNTKISAYDLYPRCKLGIVWTSKVGLELPMLGIPVIVAGRSPYCGKGFTIDPASSDEYFERILCHVYKEDDSSEIRERIRLSRSYFYLYYFVYQINNGIFPWRLWDESPVCTVQSYEELLPGANPYLDYICDAIIEDKPILGSNRWPPDS